MFFVDDGISGTSFERSDFQRMQRMAEEGKICRIIVKDLSLLDTDDILPDSGSLRIRVINSYDDVLRQEDTEKQGLSDAITRFLTFFIIRLIKYKY